MAISTPERRGEESSGTLPYRQYTTWSRSSMMEDSRWWPDVAVVLGVALSPRWTSLLPLFPLAIYGAFRAARFIARLWHMHQLTSNIPGPSMSLIRQLWQARGSSGRVSEVIQKVLQDHWPIFKFWSGPFLFMIIQDSRDMEFVLSNKSITRKSFMYNMLAAVQGVGLIHLSYGNEWKRHRKIVSPFLGSDVLRDFVPIFYQKSKVMIRRLEDFARSGETFNIYEYVSLVINDSVCHTVMATDMHSQENDEREFGRAVTSSLAIITYRALQPWFLSNTLFRLSRYHGEFQRNIATLHGFMQRVLATKRHERERQQHTTASCTKPTFVDLMLDSPEDAAFTDEEIQGEAKTLVSAAAGATTDALAFILLCLSLSQDVQDKVIQELDDIFCRDVERAVMEDDVRHMHYLERVIKESLRMFPSVPMFGRSVTTDVRLPSGYWVPAGTQLFLYTPGAHRNPQHFPEPSRFDPDRFLPDSSGSPARGPFAYLPFSAGPRNCVGQRFAYLQIKTTVATLLRHYRLLPSSENRHPRSIADIKTNFLITLSARGGYNLRLQERVPP